MSGDPLDHARTLAAEERYDHALRVAWRAAMPMVTAHDRKGLQSAATFADGVAERTSGSTHDEAVQLSLYCSACIDLPQMSLLERWSLSNLFSRRRREKRCPDCAEDVNVEARVCRFCGFRFEEPPQSG